jgi:hypothetical protein
VRTASLTNELVVIGSDTVRVGQRLFLNTVTSLTSNAHEVKLHITPRATALTRVVDFRVLHENSNTVENLRKVRVLREVTQVLESLDEPRGSVSHTRNLETVVVVPHDLLAVRRGHGDFPVVRVSFHEETVCVNLPS